MNVTSSLRICLLVNFFGFIVRFSDCLKISAVYGESDVEFLCVINPYTGSQQWFVDSVKVAVCGAIRCSVEPTNPSRYSFTSNFTSGVFFFKIDFIDSTDDNRVVGCYDGTNTHTLFIDFQESSVLLQTFDGETTYPLGSVVGLSCTITPYNDNMTWYVDNELYAGCFLGKCDSCASKPYTFTFIFNEIAGEFKLIIDSVNSSHAGLVFACNDGIVRKTISVYVAIDGVFLSATSNSVTTALQTKQEANINTGRKLTDVSTTISTVSRKIIPVQSVITNDKNSINNPCITVHLLALLVLILFV